MTPSVQTPAVALLSHHGSQATWARSLQIGVQGKCPEDQDCKALSQPELCPLFFFLRNLVIQFSNH